MTLEERIKEMEEMAEQEVNPYEVNISPQGEVYAAKKALSIIQALQNKNKELEEQQEAETMYYESKNENLTRLEVIDESGRVYINNKCKMELSYQDEGRTLKIFVNNGGVK
jgi:hypothetical protein